MKSPQEASPRKPVETLNEVEQTILLNALQNWPSLKNRPQVSHRNYTIALLMLDAGLRVGEVVNLRISDLYFHDEPVDSIDIPAEATKTHFGRSIPTSNRLKEALNMMQQYYWRHIEKGMGIYAFYTKGPDLPLTVRQVQRIIRQVAKSTIGRDIHPHVLRHTFATKLMRKTSIRVVQQLLGHKALTSTQVYTHPNSDDMRKAIDSL